MNQKTRFAIIYPLHLIVFFSNVILMFMNYDNFVGLFYLLNLIILAFYLPKWRIIFPEVGVK